MSALKKAIIFSILSVSLVSAYILFSQGLTYVGVQKCQICHRTEKQGQQYSTWEKSGHSQSFAALSTPEAGIGAQGLGVADPAESPKCLKCHSPLFEKAQELKAEGVTCEVCHGPGSEYKKLNIMRNREEASKNGLIVYPHPEAIKKLCFACHENAHGKSFDFTAAWEKIKHSIPGR